MRLQQTASKEHEIVNSWDEVDELDLRDEARKMELEILNLLNKALHLERSTLDKVEKAVEEEKLALQPH